MDTEWMSEEQKNYRMYSKNFDECITEYPFFRDGMTCEEFYEEQRTYFAFLSNGGHLWDFKSLWKRRQEGEDV